MKKYITKEVKFSDLKPGDKIMVSYGFITLTKVRIDGDNVTLYSTTQEPITLHVANTPQVAIGFTNNYQKAYPNEKFVASRVIEVPPSDPLTPIRIDLKERDQYGTVWIWTGQTWEILLVGVHPDNISNVKRLLESAFSWVADSVKS